MSETMQSLRSAALAAVFFSALSAPATAADIQVFTSDFESGTPAGIAGGATASTGGYSAYGFGTTYYRSTGSVTLTLSGLATHTSISIDFLLALIDSWDGSAASHNCCAPDFFTVSVDGNQVFNNTFNNVWGFVGGFGGPDTQGYPRGANELVAPTGNLVESFWHDSAYDMGADPVFGSIAHSASTLTITFASTALQGLSDESFAIDNLSVTLRGACGTQGCDIPEPATLAIVSPLLLGLVAMRRRRRP